MRGRWTINLLLLALVALLSTAVQRELEQSARITTLTELAPERIEAVGLERPGQPPIELLHNGAVWRMESPYRVAADGERIAQLLRIAATEVYRSLPEDGAGPRLGLEPGRALLSLDGLTLRFGDTEPIAQHRYVAVGGQVHLIPDGFQHHLIAPAEDYVSPRLLPDDLKPAAGSLDGEALDQLAMEDLGGLKAERVVALDEEINGRLLSLTDDQSGSGLRFLVSADGRRWTRLDLRLVYLLADPPFWALSEHETQTKAKGRDGDQGQIDLE